MNLLKNQLENYRRLFKAEEQKFDNGESSLFLVNSREQAYINARIKLAEIVAKNKMSYYAIWYFVGRLPEL